MAYYLTEAVERARAAEIQRRHDRAVALWAALVGALFATVLWFLVTA